MRGRDVADGVVVVRRMGGSRDTERKFGENLGGRRGVKSGLLVSKPREVTLESKSRCERLLFVQRYLMDILGSSIH